MSLIEKLNNIEHLIGNTPLIKLKSKNRLFAKLEYNNFMGSIKDRPAFYILKNALKDNLINNTTTVIESTSGNFGIALAGICQYMNIKFIPVIDSNITLANENILKNISFNVVKIDTMDESGGYLLNRIKKVKELLQTIPNTYNPNQYENADNYLSYYNTLGSELCNAFEKLDFVFISVSSGGTITGLSLRLKKKFPHIKIIAVDIEGSLIFQQTPKKRVLSGMGSSLRTKIIDAALIDKVIILSQKQIIEGCLNLLREQSIFGGTSSGAAYYAANLYLDNIKDNENLNALIICPDRGITYSETIYNQSWVLKNIY